MNPSRQKSSPFSCLAAMLTEEQFRELLGALLDLGEPGKEGYRRLCAAWLERKGHKLPTSISSSDSSPMESRSRRMTMEALISRNSHRSSRKR